jgi:hypothetical protein
LAHVDIVIVGGGIWSAIFVTGVIVIGHLIVGLDLFLVILPGSAFAIVLEALLIFGDGSFAVEVSGSTSFVLTSSGDTVHVIEISWLGNSWS